MSWIRVQHAARIRELQERILHADGSGAGLDAKLMAAQELMAHISSLRKFGSLKLGQVQDNCYDQADALERWLSDQGLMGGA